MPNYIVETQHLPPAFALFVPVITQKIPPRIRGADGFMGSAYCALGHAGLRQIMLNRFIGIEGCNLRESMPRSKRNNTPGAGPIGCCKAL